MKSLPFTLQTLRDLVHSLCGLSLPLLWEQIGPHEHDNDLPFTVKSAQNSQTHNGRLIRLVKAFWILQGPDCLFPKRGSGHWNVIVSSESIWCSLFNRFYEGCPGCRLFCPVVFVPKPPPSSVTYVSSGLHGPDSAAPGHLLLRGHLHLPWRRQDICPQKPVDILRVLRHLLRLSDCAELLRRLPPQTPMEPGGPGTSFSLVPVGWPRSFSCIGLEEESFSRGVPHPNVLSDERNTDRFPHDWCNGQFVTMLVSACTFIAVATALEQQKENVYKCANRVSWVVLPKYVSCLLLIMPVEKWPW